MPRERRPTGKRNHTKILVQVPHGVSARDPGRDDAQPVAEEREVVARTVDVDYLDVVPAHEPADARGQAGVTQHPLGRRLLRFGTRWAVGPTGAVDDPV